MITIFNRVELLITHNQKQWMRMKSVLDSNNIEYITRIRSAGHRWAPRSDSQIGIDDVAFYEYRIYVKKKDHDLAISLINGNW